MNKITLINPVQAQDVFINHNWTDTAHFFIKGTDDITEFDILTGSNYSVNSHVTSIIVKFYGSEYTISLDTFEDDVTIEFKDIQGLGALVFLDNIPYLLRVFRSTNNEEISLISARFPDLRIIDFGGENKNIKNLEGINACESLHTINLNRCYNLHDFSALSSLTALKSLDLSWCQGLTDLSPIEGLTALESLDLSSCQGLTDLSPIEGLTALTKLNLIKSDFIKDYSGLEGLTSLTNLSIGGNIDGMGNSSTINLKHLASLSALKSLVLDTIEDTDFTPLADLTALTDLEFRKCDYLADLSFISGLAALTNLKLHGGIVTDLRPLSSLSALISFQYDSPTVLDWSPLSGLFNLEIVHLKNYRETCDLSFLECLTSITDLNFSDCYKLTNYNGLLNLVNLRNLKINYANNLFDLDCIVNSVGLTNLSIVSCDGLVDISALSSKRSLTNLNLSWCQGLTDLSPIEGLTALTKLNLSYCPNVVKIEPLTVLPNLFILELEASPNIRDFERLAGLNQLIELTWVDPLACTNVLMQCACNRYDTVYIFTNFHRWVKEVFLCKEVSFVSNLLSCIALLEENTIKEPLLAICSAMRIRGLQGENLNDLDTYHWESWCGMVLQLSAEDAMACLIAAVSELNLKRETEVVLAPIIVAASEFIQKHPDEKDAVFTWVNAQLLQLQETEEMLIAPSASVFFASLNLKEEVVLWLTKATTEKAPLWREKVLSALIKFYAVKDDFVESKRLLAEMQVPDEKDKAIAVLALAMARKYPIEASFLLDDIKEAAITTEAARKLLASPEVFTNAQSIYQLLLHLQGNADELAACLETMIVNDISGKVADGIKSCFLQKQQSGPSAAVLFELCKHPAILEFVKPRALEKYKAQLQERMLLEITLAVGQLVEEMKEQEMIEIDEAIELIQLIQKA